MGGLYGDAVPRPKLRGLSTGLLTLTPTLALTPTLTLTPDRRSQNCSNPYPRLDPNRGELW